MSKKSFFFWRRGKCYHHLIGLKFNFYHITYQLICLSKAEEFADMKFQPGEKGYLNEVIKKKELRYNVKGKLQDKWQRIFCLIQVSKFVTKWDPFKFL